jgi:hypothetical protein
MIIEIPRIMRGSKQELETSINEEAFLFANFLRNENKEWIPSISRVDFMRAHR